MSIRRLPAVTAILGLVGAALLSAPSALAGPVRPDVVNGREPTPGEIRALVYVSAGGYSCGGTLVDATHVVTAAHCAVDRYDRPLSPSQVRVGWAPTKLFVDITMHAVTAVAVHPSYNPNELDNDIAVFTLAAAIPGATPMPVATVAESTADLAAGDAVKSAGYGNTSSTGYSSDRILVADLTVLPDSICGDASKSYKIGSVTFYGMGVDTDHTLCAIGVESGTRTIIDTCQGDSGGPLFAGSPVPVLLGVVSGGIGCAGVDENGSELSEKTPGLYTRVAFYRDWLASQGVDVADSSAIPAAPQIVSAVPGADSLTVAVAPGDSTPFDGYWIQVVNVDNPDDAQDCTMPADETSCAFADLTPGATYAVTVIAMGINGDSAESPATLVTIAAPATTKPARPTITKGWDKGNGRVKLKVKVGKQPAGTHVYVYCASKLADDVADVKKGYANLKLVAGAKYTCKAYAENDAGLAQSRVFRFAI